MPKAFKCPACNLYYNGQVYQKCPHCNTENSKAVATDPESKAEKINTEQAEACSIEKENKSEIVDESKRTVSVWNTQRAKIGFAKLIKPKPENKQNDEEKCELEQVISNKKSEQGKQQNDANIIANLQSVEKEDTVGVKEFNNSEATNLKEQLRKSGRTIGKFTSSNDVETVDPVVGWVVCVKGQYFGQSFALKSGKNKMGRSSEMDVKLLNDESVSRTCVATIVFDTRTAGFSIIPGESDSLCYVNNEALYERMALNGFEEIELGDSEQNKFIFVPLCGERFDWKQYKK